MLQFIALLLLGVTGIALFLRWQVRSRTRQLVESRADLQATLNTLPDMLFEVDLDGRFHDYQDASDNQSLVPVAAFMGKTVAEIMPVESLNWSWGRSRRRTRAALRAA